MEAATLYFNDHLAPDGKFTARDIEQHPELREDAANYLEDYTGTFGFLVSLRVAVMRSGDGEAWKANLTPKQAAGVLNCWRAEHLNRIRRVLPDPTAPVFKHVATLASRVRRLSITPAGVVISRRGENISVTSMGIADSSGNYTYYGRLRPDGEFRATRHITDDVLATLRELDEGGIGYLREAGAYCGECPVCLRPVIDIDRGMHRRCELKLLPAPVS